MTAAALDLDHLRKWIGKTSESSDVITAQMVRGLRATFFLDIGSPGKGDAAPLAIHWCLAPQVAPMSELGPDGHPARGGFLPPVPLPRRMWAGGKTDFRDPLRVGDEVKKVSRITTTNPFWKGLKRRLLRTMSPRSFIHPGRPALQKVSCSATRI